MSTGIYTRRTTERDTAITEIIFDSTPGVWRTPGEWWSIVAHDIEAKGVDLRIVNFSPACVAVLIRRLRDEGDMESRRNPNDARSTQYRVTP